MIAELSVSSLHLQRNQAYRGQCLLIFDLRHVTGIELLTRDEFEAFADDLRTAARAIVRAINPDRMNYASLGNIVEHLHWHIIPRSRTDPRWGKPIWMTTREEMADASLTTEQEEQIVAQIHSRLEAPDRDLHKDIPTTRVQTDHQ